MLAEAVLTGGYSAVMDKEYIYLGQIDEIQRLPKDGGNPQTLAYGDKWDVVCSLSVDDSHIYASTFGPYDQKQGAILKIDKHPPEPF